MRVTFLVTAHDRATEIGPCLRSIDEAAHAVLGAAEYEILLVDDRSRDGTSDAAHALRLPALEVLRIETYVRGRLTARQLALDAGLRRARGELIVIVEDDARLNPGWLRSASDLLRDGADAVAAPVSFRPAARRAQGRIGPHIGGKSDTDPSIGARLCAALLTADSVFYIGVCSLLNRLGFAPGVLFGGFAFRRALYEQVGGFTGIGFALNEDLAFARALHRAGARLRFLPTFAVEVWAPPTLGALVLRARRVSAGGASALGWAIGLWEGTFVLLGLGALVSEPLRVAWIARWMLGALWIAVRTVRAGRPVPSPSALIYEPFAVTMGAWIWITTRGRTAVEWGGVRYARNPSRTTGDIEGSRKPGSSVLRSAGVRSIDSRSNRIRSSGSR